MDQVFTLKILAEKYSQKKKDIFACFLDLEKAYDRVQREKLWEVFAGCGVNGGLLNAIIAFNRNSMACVRINRKEGEMFKVGVV